MPKRKRNDAGNAGNADSANNAGTGINEVVNHTKRFAAYFGTLHQKLEQLHQMIGINAVKKQVIAQLKFLLCNKGKTDDHFLHTIIQGPSGCGKTTLAKVLHNIWSELEVFENNAFTVLHRSDLVGSYMGQTAAKTKKTLMKHRGGCIFIDEFYSLVYGNDSYGKECIDVLNTFMSEYTDTVVIVAGYEHEMTRVFDAQPGLKRRFAWTFTIPKYNAKQLFAIFQQQLAEHNWTLKNPDQVQQLFHKNYHKFEFAGGDTLNLCLKSKIQYAQRHWKIAGKQKITTADVQAAMDEHFVHTNNNTMYI